MFKQYTYFIMYFQNLVLNIIFSSLLNQKYENTMNVVCSLQRYSIKYFPDPYTRIEM